MYEYLITVAESIYKNGLSTASLGIALFALLKTKAVKKRLRRFIPWALDSDSEVKAYIENQHRIMERLGIDWQHGQGSREQYIRKNSMKSSISSQGGKNMKNYLRKLGSKKFQAFLLMTATNGITLFLVLNGVVDIDVELEKYMPATQTIIQLLVTSLYLWVEGSLDKARIQNGGEKNGIDFTQDTSE